MSARQNALYRGGLLVSAGSDCHGDFQDTQIGQTKTDMRDVC